MAHFWFSWLWLKRFCILFISTRSGLALIIYFSSLWSRRCPYFYSSFSYIIHSIIITWARTSQSSFFIFFFFSKLSILSFCSSCVFNEWIRPRPRNLSYLWRSFQMSCLSFWSSKSHSFLVPISFRISHFALKLRVSLIILAWPWNIKGSILFLFPSKPIYSFILFYKFNKFQ